MCVYVHYYWALTVINLFYVLNGNFHAIVFFNTYNHLMK